MMKESLELFSGDKDYAFSLILQFILLATEVNAVKQKKCCKRNAVEALGSGGGKIILTLLAKVIPFYMELTTIDVR